jgi:hypothetical protein
MPGFLLGRNPDPELQGWQEWEDSLEIITQWFGDSMRGQEKLPVMGCLFANNPKIPNEENIFVVLH